MLSTPTLPAVSASNSSLVLPVVPAKSSTPFNILKTLHERVENLPKSVPLARKTIPVGTSHDPVSQPNVIPVRTSHDLVSQHGVIPVGISHDLVSQPLPKKPTEKAVKQGRGSWAIPDIISPKS